MRRLIILVTILAIVAVACGNDGDDNIVGTSGGSSALGDQIDNLTEAVESLPQAVADAVSGELAQESDVTGPTGTTGVTGPTGTTGSSESTNSSEETGDIPPTNGNEYLKWGMDLDTGSMPQATATYRQNGWQITEFEGLHDPINAQIPTWLEMLGPVEPENWKYFPNIDNPDVPDFTRHNGVEYGTYDSPYCDNNPCTFPVGAREYRYFSGTYNFEGLKCSTGNDRRGCLILVFNVADQSHYFRSQFVDAGFTVRGRYWNGKRLDQAIEGLAGHGTANMLDMPTFSRRGEVLNAGDGSNSGANCGVPEGCKSVLVRFVIFAGDHPYVMGETVVTR